MIKNKLSLCMLLILVSCVQSEYRPRLLEQSTLPSMKCYDGVIYYSHGNGYGFSVKYQVDADGEVRVSTCKEYNNSVLNRIGR